MMQGWELPKKDERKTGKNLLIVDGFNLAFRWKHKGQSEFATDYLKTVNSLAKSYSCEDIVVLSDHKGSYHRKELYDGYKGNRDYSKQTEQEKEAAMEFFAGFDRTIDLITRSSMHLVRFTGIEADDFAAYLVMGLEGVYDNIWLISTDKDWDELLSPKVHRFSYASRKEFFFNNGEEGCNFFDEHACDNPEQYVLMKCLKGDLSDGIRGVEGIGDKRAYSIIRNYDSLYDLIDDLPLPGKQKYIQNLNASEEILERNLMLMDLKTFSPEIIAENPEALEYVDNLIDTLTNQIHDSIDVEDISEL